MKVSLTTMFRFSFVLASSLLITSVVPCFADQDSEAKRRQAQIDSEEAQDEITRLEEREQEIQEMGGPTAEQDREYQKELQAAQAKKFKADSEAEAQRGGRESEE